MSGKPHVKRHYRGMTQERAERIRRDYFTRVMNQRELAEREGIRQGSVSRIVSGLVWATECNQ